MLIRAGRIFTPAEHGAGWVHVRGDAVLEVGSGDPPAPVDVDIPDGHLVVPGFVDVHSHGGGGASFGDEEPDAVDRVLRAHLDHGTTTMVASLVTEDLATLSRQVARLASRVEAGDLAGTHLEGPWLSRDHAGAHPPHLLADPHPRDVRQLFQDGAGTIAMVTIAPELPHALDAIEIIRSHGAVAAIGHTGADYETTLSAVAAGANGATHLFNAMPPMRHRDPGPVLALLSSGSVWIELIIDGVHLHPAVTAFTFAQAPERMVLMTDAMAAAALGDGDYRLGQLPVRVRDGVARLAEGNSIAGSTLTLDRALSGAVAAGIPFLEALRAMTAQPAAYLGLPDVGTLAPRQRADLVVLDEHLRITGVLRKGHWHRDPR